jgi:hypothetical protein
LRNFYQFDENAALWCASEAMFDALRSRGIHHLEFPYTPSRIWAAIELSRR